MLETELSEIKQNIESFEPLIEPYIIDTQLLENQSGKFHTLLNPNLEKDFSYNLKKQDYEFRFIDPVYLHSIRFYTEANEHLEGLKVEILTPDNKSSVVTFKKGHNIWPAKKVISKIIISAPKRISNKIHLKKIEILGYHLDDFSTINKKIETINNFKSQLAELVTNAETKLHEVSDSQELRDQLAEQIDSLQNQEIPTLKTQKDNIEKELNTLNSKYETLDTSVLNLNTKKTQLTEHLNDLNIEIPKREKELRKLEGDINVFSTEMVEYVKQSNRNIQLYTALSLIPWFLIIWVTNVVFNSSLKLGDELINKLLAGTSKIDIGAILLSKLPFALIVISILFVSYEISKLFIKNIIHIQTQKRIFAKIGIIAKDVADSSMKDLEIDEKEKFELRTKLKMDLLKAHLANDIGEKFEYEINPSLMDLFIKHIKAKAEKYLQIEEK